MNIKKFDKAGGRLFAEAMLAALAEVAQKHGVALKLEKFEYDNDRLCNYKFSAIVVGDGAVPATPEAVEFERCYSLLGFEKDDLGVEVTLNGEKYAVAGLKLSAKRFPVSVRRLSDNKTYRYETLTVLAALNAVKPRPEHDCSRFQQWVSPVKTQCRKCGAVVPQKPLAAGVSGP